MRRSCRDRFIDWTIAAIATFGWCVIAPTTVIGCELFELVEVLTARWRELLAPMEAE